METGRSEASTVAQPRGAGSSDKSDGSGDGTKGLLIRKMNEPGTCSCEQSGRGPSQNHLPKMALLSGWVCELWLDSKGPLPQIPLLKSYSQGDGIRRRGLW